MLPQPPRWPLDSLQRAFDPRKTALPAPVVPVDADPLTCVRINRAWCGHLLGVLERLNQDDAWLGSETDIDAARQQIEQLFFQIATAQDCEGEGTNPVNLHFRFNGCDLEYSLDAGLTWQPVSGWSTGAAACFAGEDGQDGADGAPGPQGLAGQDGAPGEPGPQGPPGFGVVIINPPPIPGEVNRRCNLATFYAQVLLPSLLMKAIEEADNAINEGGFVASMCSLVGAIVAVGFTVVTGNPVGGSAIGYALSGLGITSAGIGVVQSIMRADRIAIGQAATPLFWEQLREILYHAIPSDGVFDVNSRYTAAIQIRQIADNAAAVPVSDLLAALSDDMANRAGFLAWERSDNCAYFTTGVVQAWSNAAPMQLPDFAPHVLSIEGVRSNVSPEVPLELRTFAGVTGWSVNDTWGYVRRTIVTQIRVQFAGLRVIGGARYTVGRSGGATYAHSARVDLYLNQAQVAFQQTAPLANNALVTYHFNHEADLLVFQHTVDQQFALSNWTFFEITHREV